MSKYVLIIFYLLLSISCHKNELIKDPTTYEYDNCSFIADEIFDYDLFQNYFILKLNFSYMPDIVHSDTLMNDYYYLKAQQIYIILILLQIATFLFQQLIFYHFQISHFQFDPYLNILFHPHYEIFQI